MAQRNTSLSIRTTKALKSEVKSYSERLNLSITNIIENALSDWFAWHGEKGELTHFGETLETPPSFTQENTSTEKLYKGKKDVTFNIFLTGSHAYSLARYAETTGLKKTTIVEQALDDWLKNYAHCQDHWDHSNYYQAYRCSYEEIIGPSYGLPEHYEDPRFLADIDAYQAGEVNSVTTTEDLEQEKLVSKPLSEKDQNQSEKALQLFHNDPRKLYESRLSVKDKLYYLSHDARLIYSTLLSDKMKNNGYYSLLQNYLINSGVCSKHFDLTHYHLQQWDLGKPVNQGNQDYKNAENLYKRLKKAAKKVAKKKQLLLID